MSESETTVTGGIRVDPLEGGCVWRVVLATPKANILDAEKMAALTRTFEEAARDPNLKAILREGEGDHFSFGASVPEHLPGSFEKMIPAFHEMFLKFLDTSVITVAAVRGQCLGGGLELAAFCHRVFAAPGAKLGQPEIVLGVFAPVASIVLPERMGRPAGEELCLSGRILRADEAHAKGLVDEIADDPGEAALGWLQEHVLPRSASSLRLAVRAARIGWTERFRTALAARSGLEGLMSTNAIDPLVARAEELFRDLEFGSVRRWKENTGGLAIGYMPIWIPTELLHSQGVLPVGIMGGGDELEIIRGDAFYQSYICHIPRSTIELGLNGALDCLDGMLFPAICDVIRNLSGMWKMKFPDKLIRYLDVPQDFDGQIGGEFYRLELQEISRELTERGARPYDPEALRESIRTWNRNRALVRDLYELRQREPWKVPTSELYLVQRAGLVIPVEEFSELLEAYLAAVRACESRQPLDQARVLLTGSFCEQPPLGLIKTLEKSGCYIVDDDFVQVHRWFTRDIPDEGDPMECLVRAFLEYSIESPTRYIADREKGRELVERVESSGAEGGLFCAASFCDPALLDQPMAVAAIDEAGIPWTAFKFAENNGQFQVIREQAGTFSDSIKLWSGEVAR
jgi:benzoyl-CoA reductase subunit C